MKRLFSKANTAVKYDEAYAVQNGLQLVKKVYEQFLCLCDSSKVVIENSCTAYHWFSIYQ